MHIGNESTSASTVDVPSAATDRTRPAPQSESQSRASRQRGDSPNDPGHVTFMSCKAAQSSGEHRPARSIIGLSMRAGYGHEVAAGRPDVVAFVGFYPHLRGAERGRRVRRLRRGGRAGTEARRGQCGLSLPGHEPLVHRTGPPGVRRRCDRARVRAHRRLSARAARLAATHSHPGVIDRLTHDQDFSGRHRASDAERPAPGGASRQVRVRGRGQLMTIASHSASVSTDCSQSCTACVSVRYAKSVPRQ